MLNEVGRYQNETNAISCKICAACSGSRYNGSTSWSSCEAETFSSEIYRGDQVSLVEELFGGECDVCEPGRTSANGSEECSACETGSTRVHWNGN